jgi:hypothetical protein
MNAHEQQLVFSFDARPAGQLAEHACVRTRYRAGTSTVVDPRGLRSVRGRFTRHIQPLQLLARAGVHLNSTRPTSIAPIQYP